MRSRRAIRSGYKLVLMKTYIFVCQEEDFVFLFRDLLILLPPTKISLVKWVLNHRSKKLPDIGSLNNDPTN